jgi:O-acetyl-ADP-ribose deacetylase
MGVDLIVGEFDITTLAGLSDVTGEPVNYNGSAIVNAANGELSHGDGVAWAISRAAGGSFQKDGYALVEENSVPTGEAITQTGDYELPVGHVIHAVGPSIGTYQGDVSLEEGIPLLKDAYRNSLIQAEEHDLEMIAFPAISTGIFGFPK